MSSRREREDLDETSERGDGGRSAREKDSLRRAEVRARRVVMDGESRRRLMLEGRKLRRVGREERSVIVSRRCG